MHVHTLHTCSPFNFLISPRHRFPYILLFSLMANDLLHLALLLYRIPEVSGVVIVNSLFKVGEWCGGSEVSVVWGE